jgi:hypothetical protein
MNRVGCAECARFRTVIGTVSLRRWEMERDDKHTPHVKRFLLRDQDAWLKLIQESWVAHCTETHVT